MLNAMYNGISGILSGEQALNVESNNISNVNTVAFKSDRISFSDLMYQSDVGMGTAIATVEKNFDQGSLKITKGTYDMAISGRGFFIVKNEQDETEYARAGDFKMGADGTLQMPNGFQVQGVSTSAAQVLASDVNATQFTNEYSNFIASQTVITNNENTVETINARTSDYTKTAIDDLASLTGNNYKTKEAKMSDIELLAAAYRSELNLYKSSTIEGTAPTKQTIEAQFDTSLLTEGTDSLEITIGNTTFKQEFDETAQKTLNKLSDQISSKAGYEASVDATGKLQVINMVPGMNLSVLDAKVLKGSAVTQTVVVNNTESDPGSGKAKVSAIEAELKKAVEKAGASYLRLSNTMDASAVNNPPIGDLQLMLNSLNLSDQPFGEAEVVNGIIYMNQDGNKFVVGKVNTAQFANEQGLVSNGGNTYSASAESGEPVFVQKPNNIFSNTLELSNSELGENLVNLMVYQRSFEANSKSITTSDEFLKTAIQLKT